MGHGRVDVQFDSGHAFLSATTSDFRRVRESCRQRHRGDHQGWDVGSFGTRFSDNRYDRYINIREQTQKQREFWRYEYDAKLENVPQISAQSILSSRQCSFDSVHISENRLFSPLFAFRICSSLLRTRRLVGGIFLFKSRENHSPVNADRKRDAHVVR